MKEKKTKYTEWTKVRYTSAEKHEAKYNTGGKINE